MTHGVMVTLRFLVPSFKVRILVSQLNKQMARWRSWLSRESHKLEVEGSSPSCAPMKFIKYTIVWISQNLAIPFWVVGHIHLSIHSFHDLYELLASIGMNLIVLTGFIIDYKAQNQNNVN